MPAFFLTLLLCALVTCAGREQLRVSRLSGALGLSPGLLFVIWFSAITTTAVAAWLGSLLAPLLQANAKQMFVAIALLLAALELIFLRARPAPKEPTRSSGAMFLVLFVAQLTDGAHFLVLALAVYTGDMMLAAVGGALGCGLGLSVAWLTGQDWEAHVPQRKLAKVVATVLALSALLIGISARGLLG